MKFSIRELCLVTAIVALSVGWWIEHRQSAHLRWRLESLRAWFGLFDMHGEEYPYELYEDVPPKLRDNIPLSKPSTYPKH